MADWDDDDSLPSQALQALLAAEAEYARCSGGAAAAAGEPLAIDEAPALAAAPAAAAPLPVQRRKLPSILAPAAQAGAGSGAASSAGAAAAVQPADENLPPACFEGPMRYAFSGGHCGALPAFLGNHISAAHARRLHPGSVPQPLPSASDPPWLIQPSNAPFRPQATRWTRCASTSCAAASRPAALTSSGEPAVSAVLNGVVAAAPCASRRSLHCNATRVFFSPTGAAAASPQARDLPDGRAAPPRGPHPALLPGATRRPGRRTAAAAAPASAAGGAVLPAAAHPPQRPHAPPARAAVQPSEWRWRSFACSMLLRS